MRSLKEKIVNCYKQYLTRLTYGIVNQDYCLLYGAVLTVKNNITDNKFIQYFENNLICSKTISLADIDTLSNVISWTISSSSVIPNSANFTDIAAPTAGSYTLTTTRVIGYNFLYISAPEHRNVKFYNELNALVFDSRDPGTYDFSYVGTIVTGDGSTNKVYKKDDVFNTFNPVTYYINLY